MRLRYDLFNNPIADTNSAFVLNLNKFAITQATIGSIADGGFGAATLTLEGIPQGTIEDALNGWIAKRVTATDGAGNVAYEGLITEIDVQTEYGDWQRILDPLANRVFISYSYAGSPCARGATCTGREQRNESNVDSTLNTQTTIGIKEEWLDATSSGVITAAQADKIGDDYIRSSVQTLKGSFSGGQGASPQTVQMTLTMVGYYATLQWRKQTATSAVAKDIASIVKGALNVGSKAPFLNSDQTQITTVGRSIKYNTGATPTWVQDYIKDVTKGGDSSGNRLFFQVWQNRQPYLLSRSTAPRYFVKRGDPKIYNSSGAPMEPWLVRAGGYVQVQSLNAAIDEKSDVALKARASLIEQTTYDDIAGTLSIPPPQDVQTTDLLMSRAMHQRRGKL